MIEEIVQQATTTTTVAAPQSIDLTSLAVLLSVSVSGVVAIASLYLTYKSRSQPHREFLYEKQIEAYGTLTNALVKLTQPLLEFIGSRNGKLTPKSRAEMKRLYNRLFQDYFSKIEGRFYAVVPPEVMDAVNNLAAVVETAVATDEYMKNWSVTGGLPYVTWSADHAEAVRRDPYTSLRMAEADVMDAVRKCAGVDPLSAEMRKVFSGRRVQET